MAGDSFESFIKQVEHFYSTGPISRIQILLNQMIMDGEVVFMDM